jgi:hypothetical protein
VLRPDGGNKFIPIGLKGAADPALRGQVFDTKRLEHITSVDVRVLSSRLGDFLQKVVVAHLT